MPALTSGKVLVSGASGFIAIWVVKHLLQQGFSVRGTVRSNEKGEYLKQMFGESFEYMIVEDIEKENAFDEAVKGVDAIEHTASPFHLKADDPEELIGPAVKGTVGMLVSALKNGTKVKRIVVTSSCAAVVDPEKPNVRPLTEKDWNISSPRNVEDKGRDASNLDKYRASKTLAEKAAWKWVEDHKGELPWDLVVVNPPFVFGPIIHWVSGPSGLNTSVNNFLQVLRGTKTNDELAQSSGCWVDVRDVADAHVKSLQVEVAGGNRFIVSAGTFTMQDFLDVLSPSDYPDLPKGVPGAGKFVKHSVEYDSSAAKRVLGILFKSVEETSKDMAASLREKKW